MQANAPTSENAFSPMALAVRDRFAAFASCRWRGCFKLVMILQSERFPNARRLAEAVRGQPTHDLPRPDDPGNRRAVDRLCAGAAGI